MARRKVLKDSQSENPLMDKFKQHGLPAVVGVKCFLRLDYSDVDSDGSTGIEVEIVDVSIPSGYNCGGPQFVVCPIAGFGKFAIDPCALKPDVTAFMRMDELTRKQERRNEDNKYLNNGKSVFDARARLGNFINDRVPDGMKNKVLNAELADMELAWDTFDSWTSAHIRRISKIALELVHPGGDTSGCCDDGWEGE